jgi:hypothetical protein
MVLLLLWVGVSSYTYNIVGPNTPVKGENTKLQFCYKRCPRMPAKKTATMIKRPIGTKKGTPRRGPLSLALPKVSHQRVYRPIPFGASCLSVRQGVQCPLLCILLNKFLDSLTTTGEHKSNCNEGDGEGEGNPRRGKNPQPRPADNTCELETDEENSEKSGELHDISPKWG